MPIRKGDGTELSPTEIAEVRKGDGTVLWSAEAVMEDFESDLSGYSGDTGNATLQTSTVKNGQQALDLGSGTSYIVNPSILTVQDETYRCWVQATDGGEAGLIYFAADTSNTFSGYHTRISPEGNELQLYEVSDGSFTELATQSVGTLPQGVWHEIEVSVTPTGDHAVHLYQDTGTQIASLSATDTTHSSGGIGWRVYQGTLIADYLREV